MWGADPLLPGMSRSPCGGFSHRGHTHLVPNLTWSSKPNRSQNSRTRRALRQSNELLAKGTNSFAICWGRAGATAPWDPGRDRPTLLLARRQMTPAAVSPGHSSGSRSDPSLSLPRLLRVPLDEDTLPCAGHVTAAGGGRSRMIIGNHRPPVPGRL